MGEDIVEEAARRRRSGRGYIALILDFMPEFYAQRCYEGPWWVVVKRRRRLKDSMLLVVLLILMVIVSLVSGIWARNGATASRVGSLVMMGYWHGISLFAIFLAYCRSY